MPLLPLPMDQTLLNIQQVIQVHQNQRLLVQVPANVSRPYVIQRQLLFYKIDFVQIRSRRVEVRFHCQRLLRPSHRCSLQVDLTPKQKTVEWKVRYPEVTDEEVA